MLFTELGLQESSIRAVERLGFINPTEIQSKAIPLLMDHPGDFVGQAQTGTGKTAAFVLPLMEKISSELEGVQAVIIAPTRELANQINEEIVKLSHFAPLKSFSVYGGTSVGGQIRDLRRARPQVIVGTPGRLLDLIDRGVLDLSLCQFAILDEADEMLDMGFLEDVETILSTIEERQTWMFSATMPSPIKRLVQKQFNDPIFVQAKTKELTANSVKQYYALVRPRNQVEALRRFLDSTRDIYAIIFCRTKVQTKELAAELNLMGHKADALHGDMDQEHRDLTMKNFKGRHTRLLVCTDVAARGIDVNDLSHVINFSLPQDNESYVHRIGRTGRGGKTGISLSIITPEEEGRLFQIEKITKSSIPLIRMPNPDAVRKNILDKSVDELLQYLMIEESVPKEYTDYLEEELRDYSKEELIRALVSGTFHQHLKRYEEAKPVDMRSRKDARGGSRSSSRSGNGMASFSINLGRNHGVAPGDIIRLLCRNSGLRGSDIGRIILRDNHSYFDVPSHQRERLAKMKSIRMQDHMIRIEEAAPRNTSRPRRSSGGRARRYN